jgi:response regulator NasT
VNLQEQVYSVLIMSPSERNVEVLSGVFSAPFFSPVNVVTNVSSAKRGMAERAFDFIILDDHPSEGGTVRFAIDAVAETDAVVLFLAETEQFSASYEKLAKHGVFLLQKPLSESILETASGWLVSARERTRKSESKTQSLEEKMKEIRLINRAKWLLISELKMTEQDAHRFIEKQAMNRCVPKRNVAEEIIKTYG